MPKTSRTRKLIATTVVVVASIGLIRYTQLNEKTVLRLVGIKEVLPKPENFMIVDFVSNGVKINYVITRYLPFAKENGAVVRGMVWGAGANQLHVEPESRVEFGKWTLDGPWPTVKYAPVDKIVRK